MAKNREALEKMVGIAQTDADKALEAVRAALAKKDLAGQCYDWYRKRQDCVCSVCQGYQERQAYRQGTGECIG